MKELIERLCPWLHRSRVSETPDEDPRQKSGGNNPKDAPATMPKGERPDDDPRDSDQLTVIHRESGERVKDTIEKPEYVQVLLNINSVAVDGEIYRDVVEVRYDD